MRTKIQIFIALIFTVGSGVIHAATSDEITIKKTLDLPGETPPIWVNISSISGEALQVLQFDLYVQGFNFTNAEAAQYLITGKSGANFEGRMTDRINKSSLVSKAYSGASLRRQVHKFVDDVTQALDRNRKPIGQSQIAFKGGTGNNSEIFVADFDGSSAVSVTKDNTIVAAPCWVHGRSALYYCSYKLNHADIFYHNLSSGERRAFARYGGSNMSPAVSPDGSEVAMILSKDGWTDLYVCKSDGTGLLRLTKSRQDESSPCWSPDSKYICFASKEAERRGLRKISASGGAIQTINTAGAPNPTEPDWSPDGKWIAFTTQTRAGFGINVTSTDGKSAPTLLVEGEDPSWSANSRTLIFARRTGGGYTLSLLDVPTKQVKDVSRVSGSNSQSQPSWAR